MRAELYNALSNPVVLNCRRALFRDKNGTPFCAVVECAEGQYWARHAGDPDFQEALQLMGLNETVIVETVGTSDMVLGTSKSLILNDL